MTTSTKLQKKSDIELADILRTHIGDYQKKYPLFPEHYKIVYDLLNCRTAYLGGHIDRCTECGKERISYNSCRNRHCPKCQSLPREKWIADRGTDVLPVKYFHNVFTLPHELNPIILANKKVMLNIEASGRRVGYPNKFANLVSGNFNLNGITNSQVTFQYHMYGSTMGKLKLQVSTDGNTWSKVWAISGNQGKNWH